MSIKVAGKLEFDNVYPFTADTTREQRRATWLKISDMSEQEFDQMFVDNKVRQANVPELGSPAPDFELDILDKENGRTGDKIQLSSLRGRPVGLIFGSYT